jgi:hypothetical protein
VNPQCRILSSKKLTVIKRGYDKSPQAIFKAYTLYRHKLGDLLRFTHLSNYRAQPAVAPRQSSREAQVREGLRKGQASRSQEAKAGLAGAAGQRGTGTRSRGMAGR